MDVYHFIGSFTSLPDPNTIICKPGCVCMVGELYYTYDGEKWEEFDYNTYKSSLKGEFTTTSTLQKFDIKLTTGITNRIDEFSYKSDKLDEEVKNINSMLTGHRQDIDKCLDITLNYVPRAKWVNNQLIEIIFRIILSRPFLLLNNIFRFFTLDLVVDEYGAYCKFDFTSSKSSFKTRMKKFKKLYKGNDINHNLLIYNTILKYYV